MSSRGIRPLANDFVTVIESPDTATVYCYSPGLCRLDSGRLIATMDLGGPGVSELPGAKSSAGDYACNQGKVFVSNNHGETWEQKANFPFYHARPFAAGDSLYVLGHAGDLTIMRSDDNSETWSEAFKLTEGQYWHQAPCNVWYANDCVYLVMEREVYDDCQAWTPSVLAPVLMRGRCGDDLCKFDNWTLASEVVFRDLFRPSDACPIGVSFQPVKEKATFEVSPGRLTNPIGWLETNVVQIMDSEHYWYDKTGRTFHLLMRTNTNGTGYGALAKVTEQGDSAGTGAMQTSCEQVPSDKDLLFLPIPGGQMKFHLLYDEVSELYWLLSTQATDSMKRVDLLPEERYDLPYNQRTRLVLHFSRNLVDWCFAGLVAVGESERQARHYASMVIDGDNLAILSRSGNEKSASAHNGNLITFHCVKDFRELVY